MTAPTREPPGPPPTTDATRSLSFAAGDGECAALVRSLDWSRTALGPTAGWPPALQAAVSICLSSDLPLMVCWGPRFVQIYNDAYRQLMGSKHPSGMGQPAEECWPEIAGFMMPLLRSVLEEGRRSRHDDQPLPLSRHGYLEEAYFDIAHSPIRDAGGAVGGVFHSSIETTREVIGRRRLRALQRAASTLRGLPEPSAVGAAALSILEEGAADVPAALLVRAQADGAARVEASVGLRAPPATLPLPFADVAAAALADGPGLPHGALGLEAAEGRPPPGAARVVPLEGLGPEPAALVLLASARRPFDGEYRAFLDLLGDQVRSGLADAARLAEEHARAERLAELDRAKTAFFSDTSHELRTPLTLILAPLEDLLGGAHGPLAPPLREELVRMRRNAARLLRLVSAVLDFTRVEAGGLALRTEPTDLAALTAELAETFRPAAERAGLALVVDCPPLEAPVRVDRGAWEKVVLNLLSNAFKHTLAGGIRVALAARDGAAVLTMSDTGAGIPPDALPRVFERFYRVEGARAARSQEGTGIGLALVAELVRRHGGGVSAESAPGVGSTFTVSLPLAPAGEAATASAAGPSPEARDVAAEAAQWVAPLPAAPGPESSPLLDASVLVVDDNPDLRAYLARTLGALFRVESAADGQAALERLREGPPPDVVVSDVMMPRLGGFGLLRAMRDDAALQGVPVVILSARAGEEAAVEGLEAGADDYLAKPFGPRELLARVRGVVERTRLRRALAEREARAADLERAVRVRDEFISVTAHELRTPIAALGLRLGLVEKRLAGTSAADRVAAVRRQLDRVSRVVEDLVEVSRVTTGGLSLDLDRHDLTRVVTAAVLELQDDLARAECPVKLRLAPTAPAVFDRARVTRALKNVIANAAKFGRGHPVEIEAAVEDGDVRIRVLDHGPGVEPGERDRIFDRFARAVSDRHFGGLGLGLWLTRVITEAHGGAVEVEETPGGGATFVLSWPADGAGALLARIG